MRRRRRLAVHEIAATPEDPQLNASDNDDAEIEQPNFRLLDSQAAASGAEPVDSPPSQHVPSVFHLYQDGLTPGQTLQLAFVRRRPPRTLRDAKVRIEDEFAVPRPTLSLSDVLPSRMDVPLDKFWLREVHGNVHASCDAGADGLGPAERSRALASAHAFFIRPREATDEEVARWRRLSERDWRQVYRASSHHQSVCIADVRAAMARCRSDALALFVWEDLLPALIERERQEQECPGDPQLLESMRKLLEEVVGHPSIAGMTPKQFRAVVRTKNLRRLGTDVGAQLELELVARFQRQRQQSGHAVDADISQRRPSSRR